MVGNDHGDAAGSMYVLAATQLADRTICIQQLLRCDTADRHDQSWLHQCDLTPEKIREILKSFD